ncbi:MAG: SDR family NAD(P)-dependent oxidoreductase, partial [Candidatus Brocadiia bacterium]
MGEYLSFQDRVVAVTGGSRGIGAAVVRELASLGAQVVFSWSSSKEKADALAAELTAQGYRVRAMQCDVTKNDSVKEFFASIAKTEGKLDGLVTAAGTIVRIPLALTKPEQFSEQFNVHVLGTTHCISAAVRLMTPHRYGRIVAISSVASLRGYG